MHILVDEGFTEERGLIRYHKKIMDSSMQAKNAIGGHHQDMYIVLRFIVCGIAMIN